MEDVNALLSARDPDSGRPFVILKSGRPDWESDFRAIKEAHRVDSKIGCVFCGNPAIGAALKGACEKLSDPHEGGTIFKLHKENF